MPRPEYSPPQDEPPSKTRRKHEMHELQDLGVALVALDARRLAKLDLPEKLADAINLAKTITRHEARRRQIQYIGRLMRDVDAGPLRDALRAWAEGPRQERDRFAEVERWRERLLDEAGGVQAFVDAYPRASRDILVALVADTHAERLRDAPPRSARALFREIRRLVEQA